MLLTAGIHITQHTYGKPEVTDILPVGMSKDELFSLTAASESYSEHPFGKAVVRCAKAADIGIPECEDFSMHTGKGVSAKVNGKSVISGNLKFLRENGADVSAEIGEKAHKFISKGCTVIYTAIDEVSAGFLVLSDTVREES